MTEEPALGTGDRGRRTRDRSTPRYPRLPGDWDGLIVIWGSTAWEGHHLGSHSLAEALSAHHPVLYVDPPTSPVTLLRDGRAPALARSPRLHLIKPGLARLSPLRPPGVTRLGWHGALRPWLARPLRRAVAALGADVRAVLSGRVVFDPFGLCGERLRIFRVSDDFSAAADLVGVTAERLDRAERRLAEQADLIVCVSPTLVEKWRGQGFEPVLIANGCDAERLGAARAMPQPADIVLSPPIVGVSGQLSSRIDLRMVEAIAERGHSVLLVGRRRDDLPESALAPLLRRSNVQWVGAQRYEDVPAYLGAMDVGLVPYTDTSFNRASFPLKTLEYLAAGMPVVSTDLPAVRWLETDLVRVERDPSAFADAVEAVIGEADDPILAARRRELAAGHSWTRRAADYLAAMAALEQRALDAQAGMTDPTGRLRVASWPGHRPGADNPYTNLLISALAAAGVEVHEFSLSQIVRSRYDIVHVHWPEWSLNARSRRRRLRRSASLVLALWWARQRGAKVMWTVHNLGPHEPAGRHGASLSWHLFGRLVDGFISLTQSGVPAAREHFPALRRTPAFVVPLGHYRDVYPTGMGRDEARSRLGLPAEASVCLFFGLVRPYKDVPGLIGAFRAMPDPDLALVIAGRPLDADTRRDVEVAADRDPRIVLWLEFVPPDEVQVFFAAADLVTLPYAETFNSAAALLALSFNRPILAPTRGAFPELREQVGDRWVHLYEGDLTPEVLGKALSEVSARTDPASVPLGSFEWSLIARQTMDAYRSTITGDRASTTRR